MDYDNYDMRKIVGHLGSEKRYEKWASKPYFRKILPVVYLKVVLLGFALTGVQVTFIPKLVACSAIFGQYACDPLGSYVVALSSLPGYLIVGKVMSTWPKLPAYAFFVVLISFSTAFYFFIGFLLDKKNFTTFSQKDLATFIILGALTILLLLLFILV